MKFIEPIDKKKRLRVVTQTEHYIDLAGSMFGRTFATVPVAFDLSGRSAGMFRVAGTDRLIRYNPWIFAKFFEDNLAITVPHEVAHYICEQVYGLRNIMSHGKEWKQVMEFFGADARRTSDYDLSGIPLRSCRRFPYICSCNTHLLTSHRHNRILRGQARYFCRRCNHELLAASRSCATDPAGSSK